VKGFRLVSVCLRVKKGRHQMHYRGFGSVTVCGMLMTCCVQMLETVDRLSEGKLGGLKEYGRSSSVSVARGSMVLCV
jgi:hypothetical protein